jgi:hypothetical protein
VEASATPFGVASCLPDFSLNHVEQDPDLRQHCFCVAESCGLCGIRMKETYFCTKTKKIQKKITKILGKSEMRNQNVTYTVYGIAVPGEVFFALGIGLL